MVEVTKKDDWRCLGKNVFFGDKPQKDMICLCTKKWEMMNYGEENKKSVSFPGEYDIDGVSIKCIDAGDLLHYILYIEETRIALLQSSAALEKENIEWIDQWIVMDEAIQKEIENLDLDGEIIVLD